ncbi:MAG TPA: PTS fructose IIA subunit family protein [Lysobacter sp.]
MTVGILLVTHEGIGTALRGVAERLLTPLPLRVEVLEVPFDADPEAVLPAASAALRRADGGAGVLVLTDLYGASPANLAARLSRLGTPVRRVSALNLPMLLRVLNYADMALDDLPAIAIAGGRNGVQLDDI